MNCCCLSSTGLNDIDANNITSDNRTIFSNLNVSGFSNLNELQENDNATFITSLNISGFTILNKTTILSSLNVSGFTNLIYYKFKWIIIYIWFKCSRYIEFIYYN